MKDFGLFFSELPEFGIIYVALAVIGLITAIGCAYMGADDSFTPKK